jgi:hypothetical protein
MVTNSEVRQQMYAHIEQWKQSGLSQKAYCEQRVIRYHVFHYWYKLYRDEHLSLQEAKPSASFIPLTLSSSSCVVVELHLPGGHRILFQEPVGAAYLKTLIS